MTGVGLSCTHCNKMKVNNSECKKITLTVNILVKLYLEHCIQTGSSVMYGGTDGTCVTYLANKVPVRWLISQSKVFSHSSSH